MPQSDREKVFFECLDAENAILEGQCDEATVLIVDPPRKGMISSSDPLILICYVYINDDDDNDGDNEMSLIMIMVVVVMMMMLYVVQ